MSRHRRQKAGPRPAPPPTIDLRVEELDAIVERTKLAALSPDDHATLKAAMDTLAFLTAELQTTQTSLDRLRRLLFGARTETTRTIVGPGPAPDAPGTAGSPAPRPARPRPVPRIRATAARARPPTLGPTRSRSRTPRCAAATAAPAAPRARSIR